MIRSEKQTVGPGNSMKCSTLRGFYIKTAGSPVNIQFAKYEGRLLEYAEGLEQGFYFFAGATEEPFSMLVTSDIEQDIEILSSLGEIGMDQVTFADVTASYERSKTVVTIPDVTVVGGAGGNTALIYAGDNDTHSIKVSNVTNDECRIGDANVAVDQGARLYGQTDDIYDTGGALYVYVAAGKTCTFALTAFQK